MSLSYYIFKSFDFAVLGSRYVKGFHLVLNEDNKSIGLPDFILSYLISDRNRMIIRMKKNPFSFFMFSFMLFSNWDNIISFCI